MEVHAYFSSLEQAVLAARPFVQQEHAKRSKRFGVTKAVQVTPQSLSLNDYIDKFQVTSSGDVYDGDTIMIEQFENDWEQAVADVQAYAADIEAALDIMQEDVQDIVQALKALRPDDEAFHRRVKKQLTKLVECVIVAIRDGWPTNPTAYEQLLQPVQQLLSDLGVYTLSIAVGEDINYDVTEPQHSTENITEDMALMDKIKEVQLYPYVYGHDATPFIVGHVIAWRKG